jgi:methanogenic corrinoid protein MtbC1
MILWCAYCQRFVGETAPYDDYQITHGVCPSCNARFHDLSAADVSRARQLAALHGRLVEQGRIGDARTAPALIDSAVEAGIQPVDILVGLLSPALHQLGGAWERGDISIADEHRFTAFAESLVELVAARTASSARAIGAWCPIVLVNADGNAHTLGIRIVSLWLRSKGVDALALYPGTPANDLIPWIETHSPATLGISISMPEQAPETRMLVARLCAMPQLAEMRIVIGGNAVKRGLIAEVPGATLSAELGQLLDGIPARFREGRQ